ncbi:MAG: dihydrodipicolinate synthase family protein [Longimicrobiales bacterium]|nr:dihydrodipicolinate synthase family protein [Longimicrobiales bacterium]
MANGMIDLSGAFLPVTTPFASGTGDVDVPAFRANLSRWCENPVSGVLIAGSTGESVFLDEEERTMLVEAAADVVPQNAIVIAGTGSESTRHTIRLTQQAAAAGADAVLVSPPAYFKGAMSDDVLTDHFGAVAEASPVPVLIYQVPLRLSTLEFSTQLIGRLSEHPNIVGIKDSRGQLDLAVELVGGTADDFQVLVGSGAILHPAMQGGCVGGIVAVGLMASAEAAEIATAHAEGRDDDAAALQARIAPVHQQIVGGMGVPGVKAALDLLGFHGGTPRPPLRAAPEGRIEEIRSILHDADLLMPAGV